MGLVQVEVLEDDVRHLRSCSQCVCVCTVEGTLSWLVLKKGNKENHHLLGPPILTHAGEEGGKKDKGKEGESGAAEKASGVTKATRQDTLAALVKLSSAFCVILLLYWWGWGFCAVLVPHLSGQTWTPDIAGSSL